jgi:hypothetical protein
MKLDDEIQMVPSSFDEISNHKYSIPSESNKTTVLILKRWKILLKINDTTSPDYHFLQAYKGRYIWTQNRSSNGMVQMGYVLTSFIQILIKLLKT